MFLLKYNGTEKICFHIHPTPIYKMPTYNFAEGEFFYDAWLGPFQTLQSQMWSNRNQMNCQCYYRKIQIGRLKKKTPRFYENKDIHVCGGYFEEIIVEWVLYLYLMTLHCVTYYLLNNRHFTQYTINCCEAER